MADSTNLSSEFDSSLNLDYHQTYNNQQDIAKTIIGAPVAAVADFASSVWNSLPLTPEVSTEDILRKVSTNALEVYQQHPDAIHAASFIGGMLIPSGAAMKGMALARDGVKGFNWFSKAGRAEDLSKINTLFEEGAGATKLYRRARAEFFAKGVANQTLDALAMEGAIVATMNAHPFMEDYMADPVKNFAIGAAFGGVLGSGIGHIVDRFEVGKLVGATETEAVGTIFKEFEAVRAANQNATKIQIHEANIKGLSKIEQGEYNDLTKEMASKVKLAVMKDQTESFEAMLSPELAALPKEVKQTLMAQFASDPGMQGVDSVGLLTQKMDGPGSVIEATKFNLTKKAVFPVVETKAADGTILKTDLGDVAYFPEFGRYATTKDARYYARARDLGFTEKDLEKSLENGFGVKPNTDFSEALLSANSATVDGRYLAAMIKIDKMDPKEVAKLAIAPDDLPAINAILARVYKEPDAFDGLKITVTRNQPNYSVVEQQVFKQSGVKATHIEDLHTLTGKNPRFNMGEDRTLSQNAHNFLEEWVQGSSVQKSDFRAAVDNFLRGGSRTDAQRGAAIAEIMNSPSRKAFLDELRKNADADGNIYLWRGTHKGKAVGHSAVESYTTSYEVASRFGRPRMYKVAVDDVIGSVTKGLKENEILVGSPTRATEASLPVANITQAIAAKVNTVKEGVATQDLWQSLISQKEDLINVLLKQGVPPEAIAIRSNTPLDTVIKFMDATEGTSLIELGVVQEYRSASEVAGYLDPSRRALKLSSSVEKISHGQLKAGIDIKAAADMDHEIKAAAFASSESQGVRLLGSRLFGDWQPQLDILRSQIGNFVNTKAGNKFLTSFDGYARNMDEAGMVASIIGKNMQHTANEIENMVLKPVREAMIKVAADPLALVEANTARELNASLKGHRIYKDRQFWQRESFIDEAGKEATRLTPARFQGNEFKVVSDSVDALFTEMQIQGRELYAMNSTIRKVLGQKNMSDIGFWIPSMNPTGKHISYVWDIDGTTKLLWGNSAEDLMAAEAAYKRTLTPLQLENVRIVTKGDQEAWNLLHGRNDAISMEVANVGMQKTGSTANAIVKANADILSELAGGYQHNINSNVRQLADIAMSDVTEILGRMSQVNKAYYKDQPLGAVGKLLHKPKDTAAVVRNTLLGNSNLTEYSSWSEINKGFETGLSIASKTVGDLWKGATSPLRKGFLGGKKDLTADSMAKMDYESFAKQLEAKGIYNPWKAYDDEAANIFGLAKLADSKDSSARIIYASNSFAATVALKVGELAQPLVNAMSLPILTGLAMANKMPETFMGIQKGTAKVGGVQIMYEGMKASHDPRFAALGKKWEELGYFKPMVSEVNDTLALSRGFDKSPIATIEKALDSKFVEFMSKPADWSETFVRRQTMFTGAVLAKRLYPELDDMGVTIFARDFMDRAVGNYHAAQRPVFFQGTAGVALGLFQTYMVTMAQNMYRAIELKNTGAIAKAMLAQTTIFGAQSLPGFSAVSELIGEHYSQNHFDLTTGTYRALGDTAADFMLYGMPSNLGPALYTRGDTNPRFPNLLGSGVKDIVGVNFAMQAVDSIKHVANALTSERPDMARAFGEALSMQSMSRPLARLSELATGYSVTRKGNTMQTPEEVWTATGIMARVLSTRPIQEAKLRQTDHLNTYYGAKDRDARNELMGEIKTALRNGSLSDEMVSRVSEAYMRKGGSPTGWRSAYNTAIAQTNVNGKAALIDKLDPDSALNFMIDSLD